MVIGYRLLVIELFRGKGQGARGKLKVGLLFTVYGLLDCFRSEGQGARSKRIVLLATLHLPLTLNSTL